MNDIYSGYDVHSTFGSVESNIYSELERQRTLMIGQINQIKNDIEGNSVNIKESQSEILFFSWYITQPWYRKIYWSIKNYSLLDIKRIYFTTIKK